MQLQREVNLHKRPVAAAHMEATYGGYVAVGNNTLKIPMSIFILRYELKIRISTVDKLI